MDDDYQQFLNKLPPKTPQTKNLRGHFDRYHPLYDKYVKLINQFIPIISKYPVNANVREYKRFLLSEKKYLEEINYLK
jgi:hypothetical protein